jgi:hypothetical protein
MIGLKGFYGMSFGSPLLFILGFLNDKNEHSPIWPPAHRASGPEGKEGEIF